MYRDLARLIDDKAFYEQKGFEGGIEYDRDGLCSTLNIRFMLYDKEDDMGIFILSASLETALQDGVVENDFDIKRLKQFTN